MYEPPSLLRHKVEAYGMQKKNSGQKLENQNYRFPMCPVHFYFTCRNSEEEAWYIQN